MPDVSVKIFDSTDSGAPQLSSSEGTLISVLDACLVNGYGTVTINPLVVSGNVATGTVSAGHGFSMLGSTGPVITIAGATPSALNGEWRIASVPNSTTFTFATSGISDQTATGTITAKRTPAGWQKAFSGTNKAAYRTASLLGPRAYLRIDDTYTSTIARARGYANMTDVDTGTDPFPTLAQVGADSAQFGRETYRWFVAADDRFLWWGAMPNDSLGLRCSWWGDIVAATGPSDAYACAINCGNGALSPYISSAHIDASQTLGRYLLRGYDQITKSASFSALSLYRQSYLGYGSGWPYPAPGAGGLILAPYWINDGTLRGRLPGVFAPQHNVPGSDGDVVAAVLGTGRDILLKAIWTPSGAGRVAFDVTGGWR